MIESNRNTGLFPKSTEILGTLGFSPLEQNYFLSGGKIHVWNGSMHDIHSPVYLFHEDKHEKIRLGSVPNFSGAQALDILQDAVNAWDLGRGEWPVMRVKDRIKAVEHFLELYKKQRNNVVRWLMLEIGKNRSESEQEFDRTSDYINDTINSVKQLDRDSSNLELNSGIYAQIRRGPLGVVLCMAPYNYPLNESFATLLPAIIMGNTVVFKPAKHGILLMEPLLEAFREAFPPGVVNFVYGDGKEVVKAIMESGKIDVLAFIGSSQTANQIKKLHPRPNRLRSVLGLDAKNPAIILADADLDVAVSECLIGTLAFNGQRCTALKILFVHEDILHDFMQRFCLKVEQLKAGMPWDENVTVTPLPEPGKPEYLSCLIQDALSKGAVVQNEGGGLQYLSFVFPTVLYPVDKSMRIYHEEQFGPIVPIVPFNNINDPVHYVTESNFGQQVSIFSNNANQIAELIDPLVNQVCRVNINTKCQRGPDSYPFNGRKDSAEGTLSVADALRVFSIRTMVATRDNDGNREIFTKILEDRMSNFLSDQFLL
jgi:glyceraldehyde-3-phosphate dehydrogenase (NADP+)